MKTLKKIYFVSIVLVFCFLSSSWLSDATAQNIPIDPQVRIGKLPNGLTYYIRKNTKPEKRVELRLAVNAGSVQEDDDQQGLAHLVEHMCFNGTKNFPKNDLVHYLQSIGVGFGPELNGYTSFDETVYMIRVPTDSADILNNGIQIMRDWAADVTLDTVEIDKERGVVVEEWRLGLGAWDRMSKKFIPVLFKDSKFAERLPIGKKEIIEGSSYQTIKRFYKDWYRPDLMAFIVVGDIEPDQMEQKIKTLFGDIKEPSSPRKKEKNTIPDNPQTLKIIVSDKENNCNSINLVYKTEKDSFKSIADYRNLFLYQTFAGMVNTRMNDLNQSENPPFINVNAYYGNIWTRARSGLQINLNISESGIEKGLEAVLTENERIKQYGFTQTELDRYEKLILKNLELQYNERDKTESGNLVWKYADHFLQNSPIPGIEFEYNYAKSNLSTIKLEELNTLAQKWFTEKNRIILVQGVEKDQVKLPAENDLQAIIEKVSSSKIKPYKDINIASTIMPLKPKPGKIVSQQKHAEAEITEIVLSNGLKVILKPTDFKNDEIQVSAYCAGGQSVFPDDYFMSAQIAGNMKKENGVSNFTKTELEKFLSGKKVEVDPYIDTYYSGFRAKTSISDLETTLQLIYLYFTDTRKDFQAYNSFVQRQRGFFKNLLQDPVNYFFDQAQRIRYSYHPRIPNLIPNDSAWENVTSDKVFEVCQKSFSNAGGFTFIIVGSFNAESIKPYLETYLGSLPTTNEIAKYKDLGIKPTPAPKDIIIHRGKDPRSFVCIFQDGPAKEFTKEESHIFWSLTNILNRIYMDKLRESMSGVYGFGIFADVEKDPVAHEHFDLVIPCSPDNTEKLISAAIEEIKNIQANGIKNEDLEKEIKTQIRTIERETEDNNSWLWRIERVYKMGEDYTRLDNPKAMTELITSKNLQQIAIKYLDTDKLLKFILYPEGYKE